MGNMIAISNIVAVTSILGLENQDGFVLKRTLIPLAVYALVAGVSGLLEHPSTKHSASSATTYNIRIAFIGSPSIE